MYFNGPDTAFNGEVPKRWREDFSPPWSEDGPTNHAQPERKNGQNARYHSCS
jgi:hypothetical protein